MADTSSGLPRPLLACWLHPVQRLLHCCAHTGLLQESAGEQDIDQVFQEGVGITFKMAVEEAEDAKAAEDTEEDQDMSHLYADAVEKRLGFRVPPSPARQAAFPDALPNMTRLQLHTSPSRARGKHKPSSQPLEAPEAQPAPSEPHSSSQLAARQPQPYSCPEPPSSMPPGQPPASPQQQARSSSHGTMRAGLLGPSAAGQQQQPQQQQPLPRPAPSAPEGASGAGPHASPPSAPPASPRGVKPMLELFADNRAPPVGNPGALRPASPSKSQPRSTLARPKRLLTQEAPVQIIAQMAGRNPASPTCLVRAAQLEPFLQRTRPSSAASCQFGASARCSREHA